MKANVLVQFLLIISAIPCSNSIRNIVRKWPVWCKLDRNDSFTDFVQKMGYPAETIRVITEDNYIIGVHRLPPRAPTNRVVLIQHGMLSSSLDWVFIGRNKSIALLLHDLGYDVWLGNARGNVYSRNHLTITKPEDKSYWDFSWHEIGLYDLAAIMDTILEVSQVKRIDYIGHSQGVTTFLVLNSLRPEFQKHFRSVIGLSPIAFLSYIENDAIRIVANNAARLEGMLRALNIHEVTPSNGVRAALAKILCREFSPIQDICANILFLTVGTGNVHLNRTILPEILHNIHAGVSLRQMLHFGSLINSGRFSKYDYKERNQMIYNSPIPPDYPLHEIQGMEFYLFRGTKDTLMSARDMERLSDHLQYNNYVETVDIPYFNHLDYIFGTNVTDILYEPIVDILMTNLEAEMAVFQDK